MAQPDAGDRDLPMVIALILSLVGATVLGSANHRSSELSRRLLGWAEVPSTVAGVHMAGLRNRSPRELPLRAGLNGMILAANRLRPKALLLFVLSFSVLAYPLLRARLGPASYWGTLPLCAACLLTGAQGVGLVAAVPLAWTLLAQSIAGLLGAGNVLASAAFGLLAAMSYHPRRRRLQHGPGFRAPAVDGAGIRVGFAAPEVLPGHARWIAGPAGAVQLPFDRLSCGVTIVGEKGSGKSRLLFAIHDAIRAAYPEVPILIHDPKGEWYRTYYEPNTDLFFAPHFKGSASWGLWRDFRLAPELRHELLSAAVHAHPVPNGSFWMDQAVELIEASLAGDSFGLSARYLAKFPREHADDKFALSVFGTARLGFLDLAKVELMASGPGVDQNSSRSIDDFLSWPGRIFLLNDPSCATQQHGAFSLFLSAFLLRALSMPDVPAGTLRAVAIVDEALTFSLPPDVELRIYALCRSKGICVISGAQRLPDAKRHERGEWATSEYTFAMKVLNQESQQALSKRAGTLLFREKLLSKSKSSSGKSRTESEHDGRLDLIPPEHLGRLAPREFFLFHDRGLVTGRTLEVERRQRDLPMPRFDPREDVRQLSVQLLGGSGGETCQPSPSVE